MGRDGPVAGATPSEATRIAALFRDRDRVFSRVNRALGKLTRVSAEFEAMARCALRAAHGLGSGTDRGSAWLLGIYLSAIGAVGALTVRRVLRPQRPRPAAANS